MELDQKLRYKRYCQVMKENKVLPLPYEMWLEQVK